MAAASTASSSSSCSSFFGIGCGGTTTEPARQRSAGERSHRGGGGRLVDGVGAWVVNGFAAAFFASLERLSCIRISTHEDDDGDDADDVVPLMRYETAARRRKNKGKAFKKNSGSFLDD